ncbi:hypothetical protein CAPN006_21710 [Capnocytophaga canimorsus]|uniref:RHS repeat domain-containing protein n=1 Tax=Capnocytophaga canimorsus TaxID=28188 RepID=UPI001AD23A92|nr:RHS repeat-associated core domain-containing protein [Capnocytophaga canimorsus]GIM57779.1 hypothetical protein CAPN006_21710 [Capnocytophaga canimorsus]
MGTPVQAFNEQGELVWERELDIYGRVRKEKGISNFVPFRYQGQYYDSEIDLCYNRFRYYDCNTGTYISQDPISILGGLNLYSYVFDSNSWVDVFGLIPGLGFFKELKLDGLGHHIFQDLWLSSWEYLIYHQRIPYLGFLIRLKALIFYILICIRH